jgi:hypothetical protein
LPKHGLTLLLPIFSFALLTLPPGFVFLKLNQVHFEERHFPIDFFGYLAAVLFCVIQNLFAVVTFNSLL